MIFVGGQRFWFILVEWEIESIEASHEPRPRPEPSLDLDTVNQPLLAFVPPQSSLVRLLRCPCGILLVSSVSGSSGCTCLPKHGENSVVICGEQLAGVGGLASIAPCREQGAVNADSRGQTLLALRCLTVRSFTGETDMPRADVYSDSRPSRKSAIARHFYVDIVMPFS